ncbi:cell division protein FtsL [Thiomicrorhabdus sp. ZW0627]|uniref:cell division protein FtsL n=1 Tax=Thiomicrorhabdus sp. ZW0627 TaxID=3039774 RepID=UPI0024370F68|nr:cell division protein FtsL [Thiomicrorhabdus sp. ZW0627]MDG6774016.1 cell division protein FtsL [Thiomicrorhabdus sp. ZW0627]
MLRRFPKPTHLKVFKWRGFFLFGLVISVLITLVAIILVQHQIRHTETQYYMALQKNIQAKEEWGRLMLEKMHLSAPARIEQIAQTKLNMVLEKSTESHNLQTIYLQEQTDGH